MKIHKSWRSWISYCLTLAVLLTGTARATVNAINNPDFDYYIATDFDSIPQFGAGSTTANQRPIQQAIQSLNDVASWNRLAVYEGQYSGDISCNAHKNIVHATVGCSTIPSLDCYRHADVQTCSDGSKIITLHVTAALVGLGSTWQTYTGFAPSFGGSWDNNIEISQAILRAMILDLGGNSGGSHFNCLTVDPSVFGPTSSTAYQSVLDEAYTNFRDSFCESEIAGMGTPLYNGVAGSNGYGRSAAWEYKVAQPTGSPILSRGLGGTQTIGGMGFMGMASGMAGGLLTKVATKATMAGTNHNILTDEWEAPGSLTERTIPAPAVQSYYRTAVVFDYTRDKFYFFAIQPNDANRISYWVGDMVSQTWTYIGHVKGGTWCSGTTGDSDLYTFKNFTVAYNGGTSYGGDMIYVALDPNLSSPTAGCSGAVPGTGSPYATAIPASDSYSDGNWQGGEFLIFPGYFSTGPEAIACGLQGWCTLMWTDNSNQRNLYAGNFYLYGCPDDPNSPTHNWGCTPERQTDGNCYPGNTVGAPSYVISTVNGGQSDFTPGLASGPNPNLTQTQTWQVGTNFAIYHATMSPGNCGVAGGGTWSGWDNPNLYDPASAKHLIPNTGPVGAYRGNISPVEGPEADVIFGGIER